MPNNNRHLFVILNGKNVTNELVRTAIDFVRHVLASRHPRVLYCLLGMLGTCIPWTCGTQHWQSFVAGTADIMWRCVLLMRQVIVLGWCKRRCPCAKTLHAQLLLLVGTEQSMRYALILQAPHLCRQPCRHVV